MTAMANDRLLKIAAWPKGTLHDTRGAVVGFIVPKVTASQAAFELYSPKLRLQKFPKADWRFLIHAATNAVRAFGTRRRRGWNGAHL
jgi:DNA-binding helix-hairpin-helix protein with protein kinase domain